MTFDIEKQTYERHRQEWLSKGLAGRFAVIKGTEVYGNSFPSFEDAYTHGSSILGGETLLGGEFLVQEISAKQEMQYIRNMLTSQMEIYSPGLD